MELTYHEARVVLGTYAPQFDDIVNGEGGGTSPHYKTELAALLNIFTKVANITITA